MHTARYAQPKDFPDLSVLTAPRFPHAHEFELSDCAYWLVAEHNDQITAAVQLMRGLPVSRMEFLSVERYTTDVLRYDAIRVLASFAIEEMTEYGASIIQCDVEEGNKGLRRMLKKHYGFEMGVRSNTYHRAV